MVLGVEKKRVREDMRLLDTQALDDRDDELAKAVREHVDVILVLLEESFVAFYRRRDRALQDAYERVDMLSVRVEQLDAKRNPLRHRHATRGGELGDALDFAESLRALGMRFERKTRKLGKGLHRDERAIEIENVISPVARHK